MVWRVPKGGYEQECPSLFFNGFGVPSFLRCCVSTDLLKLGCVSVLLHSLLHGFYLGVCDGVATRFQDCVATSL